MDRWPGALGSRRFLTLTWVSTYRRGSQVTAQKPGGNLGHRPTPLRCSVLLGRSLRNKSAKDVAFPHPQSRKDHYRNEDIPSFGGVIWKFFKRTIDIAEYRNAEDEVNPAKNRTFGGLFHD
jgi:hypothetical protein